MDIINSEGIVQFGFQVVLPILLLVSGIFILSRSKKGDVSGALNNVVVVFIGLFVIGLGGVSAVLSDNLANLIVG